MKEQPFYIGQKVVALETSFKREGCQIVKGEKYTVAGNFQCPVCKKWMIDVKELLCTWQGKIRRCCTVVNGCGYFSGYAEKFAPIEENTYEDCTRELAKLPVEETPDVKKIKELVN